mmetsp:Transcript_8067/g.29808  ORF Transcript_8067/g.29808 Transcript_8067/m.29808 type:complete len:202 (-) Transcript_8067:1007-1612(-)
MTLLRPAMRGPVHGCPSKRRVSTSRRVGSSRRWSGVLGRVARCGRVASPATPTLRTPRLVGAATAIGLGALGGALATRTARPLQHLQTAARVNCGNLGRPSRTRTPTQLLGRQEPDGSATSAPVGSYNSLASSHRRSFSSGRVCRGIGRRTCLPTQAQRTGAKDGRRGRTSLGMRESASLSARAVAGWASSRRGNGLGHWV